jgi:ATP-dependent protease HslVU (ClpYQ) peptidase subunit
MTCVVGLVDRGKVWIGADSASVAQWVSTCSASHSKVFQQGALLFGIAGSPRIAQLLRYRFVCPARAGADPLEYLATEFVDGFRQCLREHGALEVSDGEERFAGVILIGCGGRLFTLDADFQVGEFGESHHALGAGGEVALGVMFATSKMDPAERVLLALRGATQYCGGVRAPFVVMSDYGDRLWAAE